MRAENTSIEMYIDPLRVCMSVFFFSLSLSRSLALPTHRALCLWIGSVSISNGMVEYVHLLERLTQVSFK